MVTEIRDYLTQYPDQTPEEDRPALVDQLAELKQQRKAIILVHNYQLPEIQDIADELGDSLGLSRKAAATDAEVIVFCGVHFMAQTAKILSPDRIVLLPEPSAGCPMADMITPEQLERFKADYPGRPVVAYVNTTAEVKAVSDICCTSANAVQVVNSLPDDEVLFVPDRYLSAWTQKHTSKRIIPYQGFCPTHALITAEMIREARRAVPDAVVMCHPECSPEVTAEADVVASTSGMVRAAAETDADQVIVATEWGLAYRLSKENPGKRFYIFPEAVCPNMKKIKLASVVRSLRELTGEIHIEPDIIEGARAAVERMVQIS